MGIPMSVRNLSRTALERFYLESLHIENEKNKKLNELEDRIKELIRELNDKKENAFDIAEKETYEEIIYLIKQKIGGNNNE
jgi:hypothetical protein